MTAVDPLYEKKVTCPLCDNTYPTLKVRSRFSNAYKYDTDFCPYYKGSYNPVYYFVSVCPQCGYAHSQQFHPDFPDNSREAFFQKVSINWDSRDYGQTRTLNQVIDTYKLAILAGNLKGERNSVLAGLCLRLAWIYREKGDVEQENRFLGFAMQQYEKAYELSDFEDSSMSELKVLYLIGELHRRLQNFNESIEYFSMAVNHKNREVEKGIVRMAREQWQVARESYQQLQKSATG